MRSTVACASSGNDRYRALTLGGDVDGIQFRVVGQPDVALLPIGDVCKRASDRAACATKVAASTSTAGWTRQSGGNASYAPEYGVATRGDDVFVVDSAEALAKAVAPLESAGEAVAFLTLTTRADVVCDGGANVTATADGYSIKTISRSCGASSETLYTVTRQGVVVRGETRELTSASGACTEGRRPSGLILSSAPWLSSLGEHFAEIAHMEAAAVVAFDELHARLTAFRAPADLLARVRVAREDEVRHAAMTTRLAERFGGTVRSPVCATSGSEPSFLELAMENAGEGCIRETYGALVAAYQAQHAEDPEVRATFAAIAQEELAHAELSWDVAAWADAMLTETERDCVRRAREEVARELWEGAAADPSDEVKRSAGMPDAATVRALVARLLPELLAAA